MDNIRRKYFLDTIKEIVISVEPSAKIYLYGSQATNSARPDSDWDLLILLNRKNVSDEVENNITSPLYDLEFDSGEVISPMIYSETEWKSKYKATPYYNNVMSQGLLL